jgi:hypothetical protein
MASVRERIGDWIFPPKGPEIGPVVLGQRRVYILPTGGGLFYGLTLVLMLLGSINYNLSLGYVLVFLLAGNGVHAAYLAQSSADLIAPGQDGVRVCR